MLQWHVTQGDILDLRVDGLLCSANPYLNLSGGVGGAFLLRYGNEMQTFLHEHLRKNKLQHIAPGNSVLAPSCGSPFVAVAHAVAIDVFYNTNAAQILKAYQSAIHGLIERGCRTIAAACLGCGYGRCPPDQFMKSIEWLVAMPFDDLNEITFATTNHELADALTRFIALCTGKV